MAKKEIQENENIHRFILLDESVVTYGLRVLIDGVDTSQFKRNPVFLSYHFDDKLPIGRCVKVWKENKQILIEVEFDDEDTDEEVQRIIGKVKRGFIKMVSAGLADMVFSDDEKLKLEGQTLPTVIKCRLREASIVGIGANHNALRLYDTEDKEIDLSNEIKLSDFIKPINNNKMNKDYKEVRTILQLADDADENAILGAVVALKEVNNTLTEENANLVKEVDTLKLADQTDKKTKFVQEVELAVKDGRVNAQGKDHLVTLYDASPESAQSFLESIPKRKSVTDQINQGAQGSQTELADYLAKSWDELDKSGKLITLKDNYPDAYKDKYKEKFGVEPTV